MNLPPRVKSQYPRTRDIIETEITPVPIETVFFLEDGKQDPYQPNRYYFDYPGNWATSNNGENIVGLRSIKLQRSIIRLMFDIELVKYNKKDYKKYYEDSHDFTINKLIEKHLVLDATLNIYYCIKPDDFNYDNLYKLVNDIMIEYINKKWVPEGFVQSQNYVYDRDISLDGFYNEKGFHITIYSTRNISDDDTGLSFKLTGANDEFGELFNVSELDKIWRERIVYRNVWDLKPCNVFSSIAEQSAHHYIGTTDIDYPEIKYFKLNSSDQRFWVEFHSTGHYSVPACFPKSVSFAIEIQFQSFHKRLNG